MTESLKIKTFICSICNKTYKSYQSIWNHNKLYHPNIEIKISKKQRDFSCSNCNKKFTRKDSMIYHIENSCKNKPTINEISELKKQVAELQKIVLENKSTTNINNGTINNTNNTVNNIIYINKTGSENLLELNNVETTEIFSKEISGVVSLIKFINFNERLPSNHSFCTKSLEGKYMLTYNTEESKIESTRKKYFYQELLSSAVEKMDLLYKRCKHKFSKEKQIKIEETIKNLKDIRERDFSDTVLREIKNQLIQLSYNCRNTVLNTWENYKIEGKKKKVFKEDTPQEYTENQLKEFENLFMEAESDLEFDQDESSDSDSDSSSTTKPKKLVINKLKKKIVSSDSELDV